MGTVVSSCLVESRAVIAVGQYCFLPAASTVTTWSLKEENWVFNCAK